MNSNAGKPVDMALIAHKGALKRVKCKRRIVGRGKKEIALETRLRESLQKMCEACENAAFEVRPHPYLDGVLCRSDGAVFVPANGPRPGHLTFGHKMLNGYRDAVVSGKHYYVHRLVAEAFHGLCPEGCEIDHINRDRGDNRPENLRWVTRSENQRNRAIRDESLAKYGVSQVTDGKAAYDRGYQRWHWANDPVYRAQRKAASERWRLKKKAKEKEVGDAN